MDYAIHLRSHLPRGPLYWYVGPSCLKATRPVYITDEASGSQIILYFTGASLGFISEDIGLTRGSAWLPTANILAIAAACPYAGYLQDLFGKRMIALFGSLCLCVGSVLVGTGHNFAQLLAGMAVSGVGAAIGELTGLAG